MESLLPLLLLFLAMVAAANEIEPSDFYFSDFEEDLQDLSLLGDAKFVMIEGQVDGMAVQVSGTRKNTVGRLLYSIPINMLDSNGNPASFSTFFEFSMTSYAGDGLAFVVAPDKTSIGASGPWLGLVRPEDGSAKAPHTFAVEFDSVMNMELRDPNSNHVGLDVETIVSAVTANASEISVTLNDGSRNYAWIDYDGSTGILEVRISKSPDIKPDVPLLSHKIDLSTVWKTWMYVGFSSSTGEYSQKHKIFSWRFSSGPSTQNRENWIGLIQRTRPMMHWYPLDAPEAAPDVPSPSRTFDLLVSLLVGFICGGSLTLFLLVGWALIKSKRRSNDDYQEIVS